MQMQDKQPQNFHMVLGLQKNTHRDADVEKLMTEVDMKMKSLKKTTLAQLENCASVGIKSIVKKTKSFIKKALVLENSISQIKNAATALELIGFKSGSVKMWELSMFLLPINHDFGTLVIRRIDEIFFIQVAELNVVLALVLSLVFRGAASHLRIGDRTEKFVISDILKSIERTLGSLGSADTLFTDTFEVVDIHVFHNQMVQELIVVMAPCGGGVGSLSCIKHRMDRGRYRGLIGFTNAGLLKDSENGNLSAGPTATEINDDGFVLGINYLDKNCLRNNVAAEAGNGNSIEDCMNEKYPSNATNDSRKDGRTEEDDVLNDCSRLKGKKIILSTYILL